MSNREELHSSTPDQPLSISKEESVFQQWQRSPRLDRRRQFVLGLILLAIVVVGAALWVRHSRQAASSSTEEAAPVVSVRVAKAEQEPIASQVTALGTIFPRDQAVVSPKVSAQIRQMPLLKNRVVRAGEVIATLESRDLQAQRAEALAALGEAQATARSVTTGTIPQTNAQDQKALRDARASVVNARATYERRRVLYEHGGISKKDLEASQLTLTTAESDLSLAEQTINLRAKALNPNDRAVAEARVNQAQQRVATLDAQLSYAVIRAPFTGVVTDQFQFEGEYAAAGAKLVSIADISEVIVKVPFADNVAAQLKVGDTATVFPTDVPGEKMAGKISLISTASDPANRTVEVWVNLANDDGRLKANGAAQVTVDAKATDKAIVVPASAVTLDAANADAGTVMVVDATSVAHEQKVTVGIRSGDKIQITSGLQGGETVVIEGNYALPDGTKVEVSEGDAKDNGESGDQKEGEAP
jgi:multidrug efflux pump subunit AcrA (membrane-fusion protein)